MANTGIDPANSRRGADAGWTVAHHRICGANCSVHRDIVDVDLDRAGGVRKSVAADGSLRRAGERFLPDCMRDHGVVTRAAAVPIWVAEASRGNEVVPQTSLRRRRIAPGSFSLVTSRVKRPCVHVLLDRERIQG